MQGKPVTVIICSWNCKKYLEGCIDTLTRITKFDPSYDLVIVDNGSRKDTVGFINDLVKQGRARAIFNETNLGFSKANNQGMEITENDVLLLNSDTEIIQSDWLTKIQETAYSDDKIGIVGCRQRSPIGFLMHAGSMMLKQRNMGAQIGWGLPDYNQYSEIREVEGVVGSCMYIKREVIDKIGGLPEEYFSYYEDSVFCLKAAEAGYKTYCDGRVTIIHHQNVSTRENKVSFDSLYGKSRGIFIKDWGDKLKSKYTRQLAFMGLAGQPTGYGQAAKNAIIALDENNVDVRYEYVAGVKKLQGINDWRLHDIAQKYFKLDIPQVVFHQGDSISKNSSKVYRIGWTMLETDLIPKEWVSILNEMDEVWTCSKFNKNTFLDSGVNKPIYVIPLGINKDLFNPNIRPLNKNKENTRFTFVSMFEFGERKAPDILMKAFNDEFKADENVQLLLKVNNNDPNMNVYKEISKFRLQMGKAPIFMLYNTDFYEDTLGAFYKLGDCFVSASMGEGWGMPQIEAAACGLPVITTGWSGVTEFLNKDNSYLVDYTLIPAIARCPYYEGAKWAKPDINQLKFYMRYVYENQKEARELGLKTSEYVRKNYTWDDTAKAIIKRLDEIGV